MNKIEQNKKFLFAYHSHILRHFTLFAYLNVIRIYIQTTWSMLDCNSLINIVIFDIDKSYI